MTTSRIKIKMGSIEVECEGSEQFIKKELPDLLKTVSQLHHESGAADVDDEFDDTTKTKTKTKTKANVIGTAATIAGKLKSKTGGDLTIAAAAHLTFEVGKVEFSRAELFTVMKSASSYYKKSYSGNFTSYLNSLVKAGKLVEPKTRHYALSAGEKATLKSKLAS